MRLEGDVGGCRAAEGRRSKAERMWGGCRAGEGAAGQGRGGKARGFGAGGGFGGGSRAERGDVWDWVGAPE